jgi:uncharacterized membrane protein
VDRDRWPRQGGRTVIGIIVAAIIAILLIGLLLKIIKIALILAICVGVVLFAQNKFGTKRLK